VELLLFISNNQINLYKYRFINLFFFVIRDFEIIKRGKMEEKNFRKYFFWVIVAIVALLSYLIIKEFVVPIISAFIISYLLIPIHKVISKKINKNISALLLILIIALLILTSVSLMIVTIISQGGIYFSKENLNKISYSFQTFISKIYPVENLESYLPALLEKVGSILLGIISYLPGLGFTVFLTLFISYFLLADWDLITQELQKLIPFQNKEDIVKRISETSHNIVHGLLLLAILEFVIALIGFGISGVSFFVLFAFLVAIGAFIPLIGPAIVWVPLVIIQLAQGDYFSMIVILITGLIISFVIDSFLGSVIVGKKAKIHPVIHLLGVIGGVSIFGFFGFIIGPLILSLFIDFVKSSMGSE